jgi:hypothetical protein
VGGKAGRSREPSVSGWDIKPEMYNNLHET